MAGSLKVGGRSIPFETAREFVVDYVSSGQYAYPAYDGYETNETQDRLGDGDLLAPQLLNVNVKINSFTDLKRLRVVIEEALARVPANRDLADADDDDLDAVGAVFSVLDRGDDRPRGVRGTTLAKIVHRKRPMLIPLYDRFVYDVYVGEGGPVRADQNRSWEDFFVALASAMKADVLNGLAMWDELVAVVPADGPFVSRLRVLDIVAWRAGKDGIG